MVFSYKPLMEILDKENISKLALRDACGISNATLAKLSKNEYVSMETLDKICNYFECNIEGIIQYIPTPKDDNMEKLKFIDLFAGIGGFRIAAEEHDMECVFSSEIDKYAKKVYAENFGEEPAGDIKKIDADDVPDFDVLFAGFPCQPFSYAGKLEGFEDKTRGTLFYDIARLLKAKKPQMFLLENVKGLKSHDKGRTMEVIIKKLEDLGYTLYWTVLNSLDYGGVPQSRERWYCVGFNSNIEFDFPEPTDERNTIKDILIPENNDDENLKLSENEINKIEFHFDNCSRDSAEQIRVEHDNSMYNPDTKKGKHGVFSYLKPDGSLRFHVGDYAKTQIQELYYCSIDSYSPTIIASRSPKILELRRKMSLRELARLQGFPDDFIINTSDAQARKQFGNAVTVPVVSKIIKNMIKAKEENISAPEQLVLGN